LFTPVDYDLQMLQTAASMKTKMKEDDFNSLVDEINKARYMIKPICESSGFFETLFLVLPIINEKRGIQTINFDYNSIYRAFNASKYNALTGEISFVAGFFDICIYVLETFENKLKYHCFGGDHLPKIFLYFDNVKYSCLLIDPFISIDECFESQVMDRNFWSLSGAQTIEGKPINIVEGIKDYYSLLQLSGQINVPSKLEESDTTVENVDISEEKAEEIIPDLDDEKIIEVNRNFSKFKEENSRWYKVEVSKQHFTDFVIWIKELANKSYKLTINDSKLY
jgi:hypothetical protein